MRKNTFIIRFIDIALTVLFGFVGVSEIKLKTQIKLPNELGQVTTPPETQPQTVSVRILSGPTYWMMAGTELLFLTDSQESLENRLINQYDSATNRTQDFLALIEPDPDSPIQLTIDLIDICKRNGIPQNINYINNVTRN